MPASSDESEAKPATASAVVVGTGALGAVIGASLAARATQPLYIGRRGPVAFSATIRRGGGGHPESSNLLCVKAPHAGELRGAKIAFFAVKAMDLDAAFACLKYLAPGTVVVPACNGAVWDIVAKTALVKQEFIWRVGFATVGASLTGANEYAVRSERGEVIFGPLNEGDTITAAEKALLAARTPIPSFAWHDQAARLAVQKWLFNVVINSLTAARRLAANGDLLADMPSVIAAYHEAYALAGELFPAALGDETTVFKALIALIESTAANENSMARDVRLGRRTEHPFLGGVVRRAKDPRRYPVLLGLDAVLAAT